MVRVYCYTFTLSKQGSLTPWSRRHARKDLPAASHARKNIEGLRNLDFVQEKQCKDGSQHFCNLSNHDTVNTASASLMGGFGLADSGLQFVDKEGQSHAIGYLHPDQSVAIHLSSPQRIQGEILYVGSSISLLRSAIEKEVSALEGADDWRRILAEAKDSRRVRLQRFQEGEALGAVKDVKKVEFRVISRHENGFLTDETAKNSGLLKEYRTTDEQIVALKTCIKGDTTMADASCLRRTSGVVGRRAVHPSTLAGGSLFLSNSLFNVDGGHRATKYRRINDVSNEIYREAQDGSLGILADGNR
ncbi:hypothetical protein NM208_g3698 [Fusarium decemcellulare]|uniref:Uncharacterized protein n=1 Tax=Fusarium decemcellulare TaxID=57161 RepID=A0ACC1SNE4_9HYPO|nr:hypothetical protein NM208_g3698 [Fusarium decemcellulare]